MTIKITDENRELAIKKVHELRNLTGMGMMDCKKVLLEFDLDVDEAFKQIQANPGKYQSYALVQYKKRDDDEIELFSERFNELLQYTNVPKMVCRTALLKCDLDVDKTLQYLKDNPSLYAGIIDHSRNPIILFRDKDEKGE